jgi:hypothetical protein
MVLRERIELSTSPLPRECSTTELPQLSPSKSKEIQHLAGCRAEPVAAHNTEHNAKIPGKYAGSREKFGISVRGTFARGAGPPQIKAAPGMAISPGAAMAEHPFPEESEVKDKCSAAARQACRALIREDIAAALHLAMANGALALEYIACGDDLAVRYLVHRFHLYANFAAETAPRIAEGIGMSGSKNTAALSRSRASL